MDVSREQDQDQGQKPVEQIPSESAPVTTETESDATVSVEEFTISGDASVTKVKELIHQSNIRRIIIKNEEGQVLIEIPLTVGVVGGVISAALFPVVAAVAVIGAIVAHLTLMIEKRE